MGKGSQTCFLSGSRLRTARGNVPIDALLPGDEVAVLRDGREQLEPVKWMGHSHVDLDRHPHREDAAPIRFRKSCLADGQPERDLLVSPEHCMIIDGLCVPAKYLANGGSIVSERDHAPFTYYHVELEAHGILLAEGTPTESYLDTGNRDLFGNADGPSRLFPRFAPPHDPKRWNSDACAPLARVPQDVSPIWTRLARRSEEIGYPVPTMRLLQDAALHLRVDGRCVPPSATREGCYTFLVAPGALRVVLASRFCIPADRMLPGIRDTRRLGVCVERIAIRVGERETVLPAEHPDLVEGWHDVERDGVAVWRWTDGAAAIPWSGIDGFATVTLHCKPMRGYPDYDQQACLAA